MIDLSTSTSSLQQVILLYQPFRLDLQWWHKFMTLEWRLLLPSDELGSLT